MSDATAQSPAPAPAETPAAALAAPPAAASAAPVSAAAVQAPPIDTLVLDAGPLLTRAALTHLASTFLIPPSVLAELRDPAARAHLDALQRHGADVRIVEPGAAALQHVAAFARQTGDLPVLSQPDLSVLALAYKAEHDKHGDWRIRAKVGGPTGQQAHEAARLAAAKAESGDQAEAGAQKPAKKAPKPKPQHAAAPAPDAAGLAAQVEDLSLAGPSSRPASPAPPADDDGGEWITPRPARRVEPIAEPEDMGGSDGEGEWITTSNIASHKARDLGLITAADEAPSVASPSVAPAPGETRAKGKKGKGKARMTVACMTGDYAVQNVLLQMNLALVSIEGARIEKVKSWVLRCHACMKICKDMDKTFCPTCGNPTLLRTAVSSSASGAEVVHLKPNFVYRNRGTKYSLPLPKGSKAGGAREAVPILRADQQEWTRGVAHEKVRKEKEERRALRDAERGGDGWSSRYQNVEDLSVLLAGGTGKERRDEGGLPRLGIGRKNPNERRRPRA